MNESHDEEAGNKHKHEISPHRSMFNVQVQNITDFTAAAEKKKKVYRSSLY